MNPASLAQTLYICTKYEFDILCLILLLYILHTIIYETYIIIDYVIIIIIMRFTMDPY